MPSLINELAVADLKGMVAETDSLIFIDPAGLKAEDDLALRRDLQQAGARLRVAKAGLIRRVAPEEVRAHLEGVGSIGMIRAADVAAAVKVVRGLSKEEKLAVRGGLVEGKALDGAATERLAELPSKPELQAKLLGLLVAVPSTFVRTLAAASQNLVLLLEAYRRKQAGEDE